MGQTITRALIWDFDRYTHTHLRTHTWVVIKHYSMLISLSWLVSVRHIVPAARPRIIEIPPDLDVYLGNYLAQNWLERLRSASTHRCVHVVLITEVIAKWCSQLDCVFPIRDAKAAIRLHRQLAIEDIFTTTTWDKNRLDSAEAWFCPHKLQTAREWGA